MAPSGQGYGLGLRSAHYDLIRSERPPVDWFEAVAENFIGAGGQPRRILAEIRAHYPVALHGVGLSIASLDAPDSAYLRGLKQLCAEIEPSVVSDHLCWTRHGGANSHDLLPVAYTVSALMHVISQVQHVQEQLGRRLYLENATAYVAFAAAEMSEAEFLAELCQRSGCGLLLDVNNLYVNSLNLGVDPAHYLSRLNPESVAYMHLSGHTVLAQIRVDTHDAPVDPAVWTLYAQAVQRFPEAASLVEWDGEVPAFAVLYQELEKAKTVRQGALAGSREHSRPAEKSRLPLATNAPAWRELIGEFWTMATSQEALTGQEPELQILTKESPAPALVGMNVYAEAYYLRLEEALSGTFKAVRYALGKADFRRLCRAYLAAHRPQHSSIKYAGARLPAFLTNAAWAYGMQLEVPPELVAALAAFEWATCDLYDKADAPGRISLAALGRVDAEAWEQLRVGWSPVSELLTLPYPVADIVRVVREGEVPARAEKETTSYLLYRDDVGGEDEGEVLSFTLSTAEAACAAALRRGADFGEACREGLAAEGGDQRDAAGVINGLVGSLGKWCRAGLILDLA